jgi:hypothetical protein
MGLLTTTSLIATDCVAANRVLGRRRGNTSTGRDLRTERNGPLRGLGLNVL